MDVRERPNRTLRFFVNSCIVLWLLILRGSENKRLLGSYVRTQQVGWIKKQRDGSIFFVGSASLEPTY